MSGLKRSKTSQNTQEAIGGKSVCVWGGGGGGGGRGLDLSKRRKPRYCSLLEKGVNDIQRSEKKNDLGWIRVRHHPLSD